MAFDPTRYGMPPKSIESVDPMQLMALDVARRTLEDAGYGERAFDRERASVIVGASGGTGDVGSQYGLRAELPRFSGELPAEVAERLPEWTEDSFAGILLNVIAGRIANRLNFGGVNFTTDAACASSLAAVYQGVTELTGGRSDFVIAGGVDTVQGPFGYLCFSKTQALSPRGRCSTFDESARRDRHLRGHRDGGAEAPRRRRARRRSHLRRDQGRRRQQRRQRQGHDGAAARGSAARHAPRLPARRASGRRASACSRPTAPARWSATRPSCRAPCG